MTTKESEMFTKMEIAIDLNIRDRGVLSQINDRASILQAMQYHLQKNLAGRPWFGEADIVTWGDVRRCNK